MSEPNPVMKSLPGVTGRRARLIAFYLPQFHAIPENDEWWGKDFTEWTNVRKAKPLFPGHNQPRMPSALGYYDLTQADIREAQAEMAATSGIEGFCYWHYWFGNGRRILERPFNEVLADGSPKLPFCLCWANQSWTGVWHGAPNRMLLEQTYPGVDDHKAHFSLLLNAFRDGRYLRVDNKPIFIIYSPSSLPDSKSFVDLWQQMAQEAGLPGLHLIGMSNDIHDRDALWFDQVMPFGPGDFLENIAPLGPIKRLLRRVSATKWGNVLSDKHRSLLNAPIRHDFSEIVRFAFSKVPDDERYVPCIIPGWDNTPRSGRRGIVVENATPELFEVYLEKALVRVAERRPEERLVFIKAWNEWAEGNFLEPASDTGSSYLDAVQRVMVGNAFKTNSI